MSKIAPSILSIDFTKFPSQIEEVNQSKAEWLHFDVMDGHFVNNLTFGPKILKDVKKMTPLFCDVHIMVSNPFEAYPWFVEAGADNVTFHYEAVETDEKRIELIKQIQQAGSKAGISIKPDTEVEVLLPFLSYLDVILIMSVEPGHGGQAFLPSAVDKIRKLKEWKDENHYSYLIEVDGGINAETAVLVKEAGADVLVAGSYIFNGTIKEKVESLL